MNNVVIINNLKRQEQKNNLSVLIGDKTIIKQNEIIESTKDKQDNKKENLVTMITNPKDGENNDLKEEVKNPDSVRLVISKDFGRKILFNEQVPIKENDTVISLLERNLEIETEYGGGFVSSILGINSGYDKNNVSWDWFYWINGVMCNTGSSQYRVVKGDKIWWDYHPWKGSSFVPSVIGCFPEPFLHGHNGKSVQTVVLTSEKNLNLAENLNSKLKEQGINSLLQVNIDELPPDKAVIALGTWDELSKNETISGYIQNHKKTGSFVSFDEQGIYALNYKGEKVKKINSAGAIIALGSGLGDSTPLWVVTATNDELLSFTVQILINKTVLLENKIGIIIDGNKTYNLPWEG